MSTVRGTASVAAAETSGPAGVWRGNGLRPDDVRRGIRVNAASVDYQLRVLPDERVVELVVVGRDEDAIVAGERLRGEIDASRVEVMLAHAREHRDVRIRIFD